MTGLEWWKQLVYKSFHRWWPQYLHYFGEPKTDPVKIYKVITAERFAEILPDTAVVGNETYIVRKRAWDVEYGLTSVSEVKRILEWTKVEMEKYIPEERDCDDFAIMLWGLMRLHGIRGAGLMLTEVPGHAKNFVVCSDEISYEIEPQTDALVTLYNQTAYEFLF